MPSMFPAPAGRETSQFPTLSRSSSSSQRVHRAPIHNPYDKFSQSDFDAWIGGITTTLRKALGHEDDVHEKADGPFDHLLETEAEDGTMQEQSVERELGSSLFENETRDASRKGKDRDPEEGPGLGPGTEDEPIELESDSEEEEDIEGNLEVGDSDEGEGSERYDSDEEVHHDVQTTLEGSQPASNAFMNPVHDGEDEIADELDEEVDEMADEEVEGGELFEPEYADSEEEEEPGEDVDNEAAGDLGPQTIHVLSDSDDEQNDENERPAATLTNSIAQGAQPDEDDYQDVYQPLQDNTGGDVFGGQELLDPNRLNENDGSDISTFLTPGIMTPSDAAEAPSHSVASHMFGKSPREHEVHDLEEDDIELFGVEEEAGRDAKEADNILPTSDASLNDSQALQESNDIDKVNDSNMESDDEILEISFSEDQEYPMSASDKIADEMAELNAASMNGGFEALIPPIEVESILTQTTTTIVTKEITEEIIGLPPAQDVEKQEEAEHTNMDLVEASVSNKLDVEADTTGTESGTRTGDPGGHIFSMLDGPNPEHPVVPSELNDGRASLVPQLSIQAGGMSSTPLDPIFNEATKISDAPMKEAGLEREHDMSETRQEPDLAAQPSVVSMPTMVAESSSPPKTLEDAAKAHGPNEASSSAKFPSEDESPTTEHEPSQEGSSLPLQSQPTTLDPRRLLPQLSIDPGSTEPLSSPSQGPPAWVYPYVESAPPHNHYVPHAHQQSSVHSPPSSASPSTSNHPTPPTNNANSVSSPNPILSAYERMTMRWIPLSGNGKPFPSDSIPQGYPANAAIPRPPPTFAHIPLHYPPQNPYSPSQYYPLQGSPQAQHPMPALAMPAAPSVITTNDPYPAMLSTPGTVPKTNDDDDESDSESQSDELDQTSTSSSVANDENIPGSKKDSLSKPNGESVGPSGNVEVATNTDLRNGVQTAPAGRPDLSPVTTMKEDVVEGKEKETSARKPLAHEVKGTAKPGSKPSSVSDRQPDTVRSPPSEVKSESAAAASVASSASQSGREESDQRATKRKRQTTKSEGPRKTQAAKGKKAAPRNESTASRGKGKQKEVVRQHSETPSVASSGASAVAKLLESRASSVGSGDGSAVTQPSPTPARLKDFVFPKPAPVQPMLHNHSKKGPLQHSHRPPPLQTQIQKRGASFGSPVAGPSSQSTQPTQAHHPARSANSPVTRSNCRYHKISLPETEDGPHIFFLVPGCSLTDRELIKEEEIIDHGDANSEDSARMVPDIESLDINAYVIGIIRLLVGPDKEQEVYFLPKPGEERSRKMGRKKSMIIWGDSHTATGHPLSSSQPPVSANGSSSTAPRTQTDYTRVSTSPLTEDESEDDHPDVTSDTEGPADNAAAQHPKENGDTSPTKSEGNTKKGKRVKLGHDAAAYVPGSEDETGSDAEEGTQKKSPSKRSLKRPRATEAAKEESGDRQLKKSNAVVQNEASRTLGPTVDRGAAENGVMLANHRHGMDNNTLPGLRGIFKRPRTPDGADEERKKRKTEI
ncbi:hypothetical protein V5O48_010018 [Marasmius crinis-equi]|uniref:Uncharacterized protein n=1 Tax=Marasmius crinis-equi TaxID=585013 RepID=A0ABR3F9N5_9AGAR